MRKSLPAVGSESLEVLLKRHQGKLPYAVWADALRRCCDRFDDDLWRIGALINAGERLYGEKYKAALETTKFAYQTLRVIAFVCARIPAVRRLNKLSFWYHAEVAQVKGLSEEQQDHFLKLAADKEWTISELRQALRKSSATELEESKPGAAIGFVLNRSVGEITRWFGNQLEDTPIDDMPPARREALRRELQPLVDIYNALSRPNPLSIGRKESIRPSIPHR